MMTDSQNLFSTAQALPGALASMGSAPVLRQLRYLVDNGLADLPPPGAGRTLERWQALSLVAGHDLSLARLYEGHTEALALLREMGGEAGVRGAVWAHWTAESPGRRVALGVAGQGATLSGSRAWSPGALGASHALLTAWLPGQQAPQLVAVELDHPSVTIHSDAWHPVGLPDTGSADAVFDGTPAVLVGAPGEHLRRPGFWQGSAGTAACWYGAAQALARVLYAAVQQSSPTHPSHGARAAALCKVDAVLGSTAALLRESAAWIDAHPLADAMTVALRAREAAESGARKVLKEVGHALEGTPWSRNAFFVRMVTDLPLFMRHSQGDRNDAARASALLAQQPPLWAL